MPPPAGVHWAGHAAPGRFSRGVPPRYRREADDPAEMDGPRRPARGRRCRDGSPLLRIAGLRVPAPAAAGGRGAQPENPDDAPFLRLRAGRPGGPGGGGPADAEDAPGDRGTRGTLLPGASGSGPSGTRPGSGAPAGDRQPARASPVRRIDLRGPGDRERRRGRPEPRALLAILEGVNSPWLRAQVDLSGAAAAGEGPPPDRVLPRVATLRVAARSLEEGATLDRVFPKLAAAGFDGWVILEGGEGGTVEQGLEHLRQGVRLLRSKLAQHFPRGT